MAACIGGGPAGLYFALLMKKQDPSHRKSRWSSATAPTTPSAGAWCSPTRRWATCRPTTPTAAEILDAFNHWDDIEVNIRGHKMRSGGHGFCGIGRKRLLNILQERACELGVELVFETDARTTGLSRRRPRHRQRRPEQPHPHQSTPRPVPARHRPARVPLRLAGHAQEVRRLHLRLRGDRARLVPGARLPVRRRDLHLHRRDAREVWKAGLDKMEKEAIAFCEKLFAKYLDGHADVQRPHLRGSAQWIRFPRVVCRTWVHRQRPRRRWC
jgi:anthraniloyl-CoA monooxygenase